MPPKSQNKEFGNSGEQIAQNLLVKSGHKIIDRNFRSRFGEIDLVAIKNGELIFVEVKTRHGSRFGMPQEAVTLSKINKIKKTAEYYSILNPNLPKKIRIKVVALIIENSELTYQKIIDVF